MTVRKQSLHSLNLTHSPQYLHVTCLPSFCPTTLPNNKIALSSLTSNSYLNSCVVGTKILTRFKGFTPSCETEISRMSLTWPRQNSSYCYRWSLVPDQIRDMLGRQIGKPTFGWITYKFVITWSKKDFGLCKIHWRIGSRFSAHTGGADLEVVDT